jgi:hypothetical protein
MVTFMRKLYNCIHWCICCGRNTGISAKKQTNTDTIDNNVKFVLFVLDFSQKQAACNYFAQNCEDATNWILNGVMPREYFCNNLISILDIANSLPEHIVLHILECLDMYWVFSTNTQESTLCKNIIQQFQKRNKVVENPYII